MFNVRPERLIPWLYVEPPPPDDVPGFRMNADGSVRDTQRSTPRDSFGFSTLLGPLMPRHPEAAQALSQPVLGALTPSPDFLAESALRNGLAQFRAQQQDDVPDFNFKLLDDAVQGFKFVESGSGLPRQETPWPDSTPPAPSQYPDIPPTPPSAAGSTQPFPPQLPEWLYKVVTMPVPQLSTAFDPRTGRRIVPYEPLIGPVRSYLTINEKAGGTEDDRPYVDGNSLPPDLDPAEPASAEPWPSSDSPMQSAEINIGPGATTAQHANPAPTPEAVIGNAWPQPPMDRWPYAEADAAEPEAPWRALMMPQPVGVAPAPSVGPFADPNFILAHTGDTEEPQTEQRMPLRQSQPTELKDPAAPTGPAGRPPERRTEKPLSQSIEDYRRAIADQIEELASSIATYGSRIYEDSILKAQDDLARLAERLRNDPGETVLNILNSFPPTRVEGKLVGGIAAVFTILANAARGLAFERAVLHALHAASPTAGITKNTSKISIEGLGRSVPDVLHRGITEIKSGVEINNSLQLRIQVAYAKLFRMPFNLIVNPTTERISQKVIEAVLETGGTIQRFDPVTGTFTRFK